MKKRIPFAGRFLGFVMLVSFMAVGEARSSEKEDSTSRSVSKEGCMTAQGIFFSRTLPPEACESPVGVCTEGTLYGTLIGRYHMVAKQMFASGEPDVPFVQYFSAQSEIHTALPEMLWVGIDTGSLNMDEGDTVGSGTFSSMLTLTSGARGYLFISGRMDLEKGEIRGRYRGRICKP